jgi:prephenate dehydratase
VKVAVLGPENSYCYLAAKQAVKADFLLCPTIEEIYEAVARGKAEQGLAPIENMLRGSVRESFAALLKHNFSVSKAFNLPIHHCLASQTKDFSIVASHPQALAQCSKVLQKMKGVSIMETPSTSTAMELAAKDPSYAAIGAEAAAKANKLIILKKNVEDNHQNITRFILFGNKETKTTKKNVRTSLMIIPVKDKQGLLRDLLSCFANNRINLTKIESFPSGKKMGEYHFYCDIQGNQESKNVHDAIAQLQKSAKVRVFGSYEVVNLE